MPFRDHDDSVTSPNHCLPLTSEDRSRHLPVPFCVAAACVHHLPHLSARPGFCSFAAMMQRDYGHGMPYGMDSNDDRFGPYESYDSRSSLGGRDLMRSGYGYNESEQSRFTDSFDEGYDNFGGRNQGGSSWDAPYSRPNMRTGFMNDRGRGSYSSFSSFSSSLMKPAPAGLRGRGMPAYPEGAFGGRGYGGPSTGRGRGRGQMGPFRGMPMQGANMQSRGGAMGRGTKRKNPPADKPVESAGKKAKVAKTAGAANAVNTNGNKKAVAVKPEVIDEEEEKRKIEARREKQRRRREKNNEKMAYTCSFCKYRSFDEKDIEAHLESALHKETLGHIQKQTKFEEKVMEFLHECMVNKYKKTSLRKAQSLEAANLAQQNMMEGITDEDHMIKVETVHCSACNVYVPALYSSVQQHFKSPEHAKSKAAFKEQVKRESILTATSILNNPVVKARYERFAKGENPFEVVEQTQEQAAEENEVQDTTEQVDFSEDAAVDFTEDSANFVDEAANSAEDAGTAELAEDTAEFAEDAEDTSDQIDFTADYVTTDEN